MEVLSIPFRGESGENNVDGFGNIFMGYLAGNENISGDGNVMLGTQAGQSNLVSFNTFIGYGAGSRNETGNVNTFIGSNAGDVNVVAGGNTFIGSDAGGSNVHGTGNVFVGRNAGVLNTHDDNTFIGSEAGNGNTSGQGNTYIGKNAAVVSSTGSFNSAIGWLTHVNNGLNNSMVLGSSANVTASNKVRIGNTAVTVIEGQVDWTFPSDARFKYNVEDEGIPGLAFVNRLRPVTYQFDRKNLKHT